MGSVGLCSSALWQGDSHLLLRGGIMQAVRMSWVAWWWILYRYPTYTDLLCKWQAICNAENLLHQECFCPSWTNASRFSVVLPDEGSILRWDSPVLQQAAFLVTGNCSSCPVRTNLRLGYICSCQSSFWGLACRGDWAFLHYRQCVLVNYSHVQVVPWDLV